MTAYRRRDIVKALKKVPGALPFYAIKHWQGTIQPDLPLLYGDGEYEFAVRVFEGN